MEEPLQEGRCQKFSGLHVNPGPGRHCGFQAAPDTRARPRQFVQARLGAEGKGITLKKWVVTSCVRAPPWEKFLCKQHRPVREEPLAGGAPLAGGPHLPTHCPRPSLLTDFPMAAPSSQGP